MQPLHYSAYYASLLAVLLVILGYRVAMTRRAEKIGVGDGQNKRLIRLKAAHENALDNIPIFVILMAMFEFNGGPVWAIHAVGIAFIAARLAHAVSISAFGGASLGRVGGIIVSWICILTLAVGEWLI